MITLRRGVAALSWNARMIRSPVSSPCAPAAGWNVSRAIPVASQSARSSVAEELERPCARSSSHSGCSVANPGSAAASSASFGLYFMVHEPSG